NAKGIGPHRGDDEKSRNQQRKHDGNDPDCRHDVLLPYESNERFVLRPESQPMEIRMALRVEHKIPPIRLSPNILRADRTFRLTPAAWSQTCFRSWHAPPESD